ncbi:unnamed protein product [Rotaria magnacalcarata]|uniref:EGF-like domain-containing protein n=2 Tax=Rotaria magnacalcarata TaxID=392030 RepID=A0A816U9S4_9BILA|nr:unnamed protein product [Rotaria magnacalcarata]
MVLHGRLLYAWLPLLVILLQAFHGRFAEGSCGNNKDGCGRDAICGIDRKTSALRCICKVGYTNTGSAVNIVCKDSCTVKNGRCGPHATCSHHAKTYAVKCTCNAGYINTGSAVKAVCNDSCTINNGGCGPHATCSHNANANAVKCTCKAGFTKTRSGSKVICTAKIRPNANWLQNGVTVAGGYGQGGATNQLNSPLGLFVDGNQTVVIADMWNHRIMQWKNGNTRNGHVVAGGKGAGNGLRQLNGPTDVLIDEETNSLIICDQGNGRVVQWSRRRGTKQGKILIRRITCWGLAMDEQRYLYVSDYVKHEVRRYQLGKRIGTLVAGVNGKGAALNQLNGPTYLSVDRHQNVYVSDNNNNRVMKWYKGAKEGVVIAGGQGQGNALTQLYGPQGLFVDTVGTLYVVDAGNNRVMRWTRQATQGTLIVGGNSAGAGANQLNGPYGLSFGRFGSLYVTDRSNYRVQRFSIA